MEEINEIYEAFVDDGYSIETLKDAIYESYFFHNLEQLSEN